jgi:carbon starvation protein CstA
MTHERRLEDLLANPVFSQGLSPQEPEIFLAMCGELSGLASQIAGSITAKQLSQASSGATVDFLTLFQSIAAFLGDDAGEVSPWEQFE